MNTKHRTVAPTADAAEATRAACRAARAARLAGADEVTCQLVHAETYAAAMRER